MVMFHKLPQNISVNHCSSFLGEVIDVENLVNFLASEGIKLMEEEIKDLDI